jgi:hypothetical protein
MPNWCSNEVRLEHENPEMLVRVEKALEAGCLLGDFVPMPAELLKDEAWYNWRLENWGTKWDVDGEVTDAGKGWISLSFSSAWSPPLAAYRAMEQTHGFAVFAEYVEEGMGFQGTYENGVEHTFDIPAEEEVV